MQYTYEFLKVEPKQLWVQLKYSAEGMPDMFRNVITDDFSEEALNLRAQAIAPSIIAQWQQIAAAPESVDLQSPVQQATYKPVVEVDAPSYDPFTERLEPSVVETETEFQSGWEVVAMTAEEQADFLQEWRDTAEVSMRQARLALIQEGLMTSVNLAIEGMDEPNRTVVKTEWEYASVVERRSPWIAAMATALGMNDEQMDDLFKLARTI